MKTNWNKTLWQAAIKKLPRGLPIKAAADRLGKPVEITRLWLKTFHYAFPDARALWRHDGRVDKTRRLDPAKVDWANETNNAAIGRRFGVSRERVRQVRKQQRNGGRGRPLIYK